MRNKNSNKFQRALLFVMREFEQKRQEYLHAMLLVVGQNVNSLVLRKSWGGLL
jgi:hypothetical protein